MNKFTWSVSVGKQQNKYFNLKNRQLFCIHSFQKNLMFTVFPTEKSKILESCNIKQLSILGVNIYTLNCFIVSKICVQ